jgi:hypothetical protein
MAPRGRQRLVLRRAGPDLGALAAAADHHTQRPRAVWALLGR